MDSFPWTIWWWHCSWREGWMPDSMNRLGWSVKIRSMQDLDWPIMWVRPEINWFNPRSDVSDSNFFPSSLSLLLPHHWGERKWKSLVITTPCGSSAEILDNIDSKFFMKWLNSDFPWLGFLCKTTKKYFSHRNEVHKQCIQVVLQCMAFPFWKVYPWYTNQLHPLILKDHEVSIRKLLKDP